MLINFLILHVLSRHDFRNMTNSAFSSQGFSLCERVQEPLVQTKTYCIVTSFLKRQACTCSSMYPFLITQHTTHSHTHTHSLLLDRAP